VAREECKIQNCVVCRVARRYRLTPREVQVIALLSLTNKAMARVLGCSIKTVAKHVEHISAKTGAENKLGIGLWAIAKGMVRISSVGAIEAGKRMDLSRSTEIVAFQRTGPSSVIRNA
jgi:DNA-binding CsgD family transcriptional regulator